MNCCQIPAIPSDTIAEILSILWRRNDVKLRNTSKTEAPRLDMKARQTEARTA